MVPKIQETSKDRRKDAKGIYFAVDYLKAAYEESFKFKLGRWKIHCMPKGKNVVIIGGGDTGNDCVWNFHPSGRQIGHTA